MSDTCPKCGIPWPNFCPDDGFKLNGPWTCPNAGRFLAEAAGKAAAPAAASGEDDGAAMVADSVGDPPASGGGPRMDPAQEDLNSTGEFDPKALFEIQEAERKRATLQKKADEVAARKKAEEAEREKAEEAEREKAEEAEREKAEERARRKSEREARRAEKAAADAQQRADAHAKAKASADAKKQKAAANAKARAASKGRPGLSAQATASRAALLAAEVRGTRVDVGSVTKRTTTPELAGVTEEAAPADDAKAARGPAPKPTRKLRGDALEKIAAETKDEVVGDGDGRSGQTMSDQPALTAEVLEEAAAKAGQDAAKAKKKGGVAKKEGGGRRNKRGFSDTQWFMQGAEEDADLLEAKAEDEVYAHDESISEEKRREFTLRRDNE